MSKKSDEQLVRESWAIATKAFTLQQIGDLFYATLFEQTPSVKTTLFKDTNIPEQALKLIQMIDGAIKILDRPTELVPVLVALGERHGLYGTEPAHFGPVGNALITTLQKGLGSAFTPEVKQAWINIYGVIQGAMTEGMCNAKGRANRAIYEARMSRKAAKKDATAENAVSANLPLILGVVAVAAVAYYFVSKRK